MKIIDDVIDIKINKEIAKRYIAELKKLAEERMLLFDEQLMSFTMGNAIVLTDTNGGKKLMKKN